MAKKPKISVSKPAPFFMAPPVQDVRGLLMGGVALHQQGLFAQARQAYEQVLKVLPSNCDALHLLGTIYLQENDAEKALALISRALQVNPTFAEAYSNQGLALEKLQRFEEALASHERSIALKPDYVQAYNNKGELLRSMGHLDKALECYDQAIALRPNYALAHSNRGMVLEQLCRFEEALASLEQAIRIDPQLDIAYSNRGNALKGLKRLEEALQSHDKALAINPNLAEAYSNRGVVLKLLKRYEEALHSCDQAIALAPGYADAYNNRGVVLNDLSRSGEALESYDRAISLKPDFADAYNNRGVALQDLKRLKDALASYDKAIAFKPRFADAFHNRGNALKDLDRLDDAVISFDQALVINPQFELLSGKKLHTLMKLCEWRDFSVQLERIEARLAEHERVIQPFELLSLTDQPELHLQAANIYAQTKYPISNLLGEIVPRAPSEKIRIGYYSADFRNHPVGSLIAGLMEEHSRQHFEIFGFTFGPNYHDETRKRIARGVDKFIEINNLSDLEVATISRELCIDIAVDLTGFTQHSRPGIFALRCAPNQVNYLGYPGTMGMPYIDYIVADQVLIPEQARQHYQEKVVYMPHSYQVNDAKRQISERVFTREELGLPESGFVFCCFNNNYKILPQTFDIWMRLLQAVEGSVLWLFGGNPGVIRNLRNEAQLRGVDPNRLVFAARLEKLSDYLARFRLAELFLDTCPYNAHATASDALWAGLPLLTRIGKSYPARVSASLLNALGLPELITETDQDYELRALELARDPSQLAHLRDKLARARESSPLFDARLFARHLESAYTQMHQRHLAGEKPSDIFVGAMT